VSLLPRVSGRDVVKALTRIGTSMIVNAEVTSSFGRINIHTGALSFPITKK
jgi:hypothetical protein